MELQEWELKELEKIRQSRKSLETLYYESVSIPEKAELLEQMKEKGENPDRIRIIEELYKHRYIKGGKGVENVDVAIRGWVNINFLAEMAKGMFAKRKIPKKIEEILEDLGKNVCAKYGDLGMEVWKKELVSIVNFYIHLCRTDKAYTSILFGIGHIKSEKLERKICYDVVKTVHAVPRIIGTDKFSELEEAGIIAFKNAYPDSGNLIEAMIQKVDAKENLSESAE